MFANNGLSMAQFNLPSLGVLSGHDTTNRLILEELSYDRNMLLADSIHYSNTINSEQQAIYKDVIDRVSKKDSFWYFISGHGGTGKTFLWNAILAMLRLEGHIVLTVASCGRTAHSRFKIPLDIQQTSLCGIGRGTMLAGIICRTSLIIWDEAPMTNKCCFEALDRTFCDILSIADASNSSLPFDGKPILFGGDFRQVLPVVEGGGSGDIVNASLLGSYLWKHVTVGEARLPAIAKHTHIQKEWITITQEFLLLPAGPKILAICECIYKYFHMLYSSISYLAERCIVCPTNAVVDEINSFMVDRVPGPSREYLSFDSIANSFEQLSDFSIGVLVVLLRNINQSIGLCNGTRILIERLGDLVLEGRIMIGNHVGESVCIPRIVLNGKSSKWPFILQCRPYPVRVCYAMTINKCQGQTLYDWTVSRVSSREGLKILIEDVDGERVETTKNIVYQ
ncbi:hypothetical protein U9M48_032154, partial [Paspalum notatum var. saurae]